MRDQRVKLVGTIQVHRTVPRRIAEEIEAAKLAALASGTGAQEERLIAKAAVKKARADRIDELATAAEDELECVADGG